MSKDVADLLLRSSSAIDAASQKQAPSAEAVSAVQHHLVLGNKREALRVATTEGVWDHAIIIASRLGPDHLNDTIARLVTRCC